MVSLLSLRCCEESVLRLRLNKKMRLKVRLHVRLLSLLETEKSKSVVDLLLCGMDRALP